MRQTVTLNIFFFRPFFFFHKTNAYFATNNSEEMSMNVQQFSMSGVCLGFLFECVCKVTCKWILFISTVPLCWFSECMSALSLALIPAWAGVTLSFWCNDENPESRFVSFINDSWQERKKENTKRMWDNRTIPSIVIPRENSAVSSFLPSAHSRIYTSTEGYTDIDRRTMGNMNL